MPDGPRDQVVSTCDATAALFYVGTYDCDGGRPGPDGVTYDSEKMDVGIKAGRGCDCSPSPPPNRPWDAGPPEGAITMQDVL